MYTSEHDTPDKHLICPIAVHKSCIFFSLTLSFFCFIYILFKFELAISFSYMFLFDWIISSFDMYLIQLKLMLHFYIPLATSKNIKSIDKRTAIKVQIENWLKCINTELFSLDIFNVLPTCYCFSFQTFWFMSKGSLRHYPIFNQCSTSIAPEMSENHRFSDVFRGNRSKLVENGLNTTP